MSSATAANATWRIEFGRSAQVKAALVGLAFCAVFHIVLYNMAYVWWNQMSDWGHGMLVPFFSGYLVALSWDRLRTTAIRGTWVGFVLLIAGLLGYQYTLWGVSFGYLQPVSMLVTLLGLIIALCGLPAMRYLWVPWLYLFFAVPLPASVYFALTDPLARLAGYVTVLVLGLFPDLFVELQGSTIQFAYGGRSGSLHVADACAGMRTTVTLCALGVAIAFASERPWWQRIVMVLACVPIAIFSNFVRVVITSLLHIFVDPRYAEGTPHTMLGLLTMFMALAMFLALGWVLSHLTVAAPEGDDAEAPAAT